MIEAGEIAIRPDRYDAYVGEQGASLSRKEFELLRQLAAADGRVLEREDIYQRVWGYTMARGDRSVDVFVRKLRQKLEHISPGWRYVHTHLGVGTGWRPSRSTRRQGRRGSRGLGQGRTGLGFVWHGRTVPESSGTDERVPESSREDFVAVR